MKQLRFLLLLGAIGFMLPHLSAIENVAKVAGTNAFTANITATAFDRYDGTLYVGLSATEAGGYDISQAGRSATAFTAIGTNIGVGILPDSMSLLRTSGTRSAGLVPLLAADYLTFIRNDATNTGSAAISLLNLSSNAVVPITIPNASHLVQDGSGAKPASYLSMIETTSSDIFIRAIANTVLFNNEVSTTDHGVAHYRLDTNSALARVQENLRVDLASPMGTLCFARNLQRAQVLDMHWSTSLERLYIALGITVHGAADNAGHAIVKGRLTAGGSLTLDPICAFTVNPLAHGIFSLQASVASATRTLSVHKVRTMETSTGNMYLIVNSGGNFLGGNVTEPHNVVYALRLSLTGDIIRNNTIASNTTTATDFFNGPINGVIGASGITQNFGFLDSVPGVTVGNEALPWANATTASVDHMEVIGDAVYVSKVAPRSATDDPGIWCSQAQFDSNGTITGWTNWERVFPSQASQNDDTRFFAVDATNGRIWQAQRNKTTIRRSRWDATLTELQTYRPGGAGTASLPENLNTDLGGCASCVLDLPVQTSGLGIDGGATRHNSLALFGGVERVVFAMTSSGQVHLVTTNFNANWYLLTTLPSGAGLARCLGYSRADLGGNFATGGYFLAGCEGGLYVYAASAAPYVGFATGGAGGIGANMTAAPFNNTFTWRQMAATTITGAVSHIESDMKYLYVVEQDISSVGSITSSLWKILLSNDVTTMEGAANITRIAQSGSDGIPANTIFTGFSLISDNVAGNVANIENHFGILSTNAGIYRSPALVSLMLAAGNNNNWGQTSTTKAYHSTFYPKRRPTVGNPNNDGILHKTWAIALHDGSGLNYYQDSNFWQLESDTTPSLAASTTAEIAHTNGRITTGSLSYLTDRSLYLFSDGGRRIFTRFNASETVNNAARFFPYYAREWALSSPATESALASINRMNWIENISGIGAILVGTDSGVIALE